MELTFEEMTALIVDDIPTVRRVLKKQLKSLGFATVHEAESADAALELLQETQCDIMILDLHLKETKGTDLTKSIREEESQFSKIPIVLITSDLLKEDFASAIQCGINDVLLKPFSMNDLKQKITSSFQKWMQTAD